MPKKETQKKASPRATKVLSKMISLRLPVTIIEELDELTAKSGSQRSSYIQIAVHEYLERRKKAAE